MLWIQLPTTIQWWAIACDNSTKYWQDALNFSLKRITHKKLIENACTKERSSHKGNQKSHRTVFIAVFLPRLSPILKIVTAVVWNTTMTFFGLAIGGGRRRRNGTEICAKHWSWRRCRQCHACLTWCKTDSRSSNFYCIDTRLRHKRSYVLSLVTNDGDDEGVADDNIWSAVQSQYSVRQWRRFKLLISIIGQWHRLLFVSWMNWVLFTVIAVKYDCWSSLKISSASSLSSFTVGIVVSRLSRSSAGESCSLRTTRIKWCWSA